MSPVQSLLDNAVTDADQDLVEADDGDDHNVQEGKHVAVHRIDTIIAQLQHLRVQVNNLSHKEFCLKHGIMQD
jgi:peptidoglycan hydrolase CwlO-like protein